MKGNEERRAIIVLDKLNTVGRIEVDCDELRAAVRVAKVALNKQIEQKPVVEIIEYNTMIERCPNCMADVNDGCYCMHCGQALDWTNMVIK